MAADPPCPSSRDLTADITRGVMRLLMRADCLALAEVPLGNGRRVDVMALCPRGGVTIVEVKVSRADLVGDAKWTDYLDYCDRFFWAVPAALAAMLDETSRLPLRAGLIVADRYDAAIVREAQDIKIAPVRRKAETLNFARRAARRLLLGNDACAATAV